MEDAAYSDRLGNTKKRPVLHIQPRFPIITANASKTSFRRPVPLQQPEGIKPVTFVNGILFSKTVSLSALRRYGTLRSGQFFPEPGYRRFYRVRVTGHWLAPHFFV